jgi:hypothetical protein
MEQEVLGGHGECKDLTSRMFTRAPFSRGELFNALRHLGFCDRPEPAETVRMGDSGGGSETEIQRSPSTAWRCGRAAC